MTKIISLPKNLSNQIAAWEVVERPSSVIKELVENAIDAKATYIKIEIRESWLKEIIVSDNGEGIQEEDFPLLAEKYSTSKIQSIEDLYNVESFWFRWEALASISSVSEFSLVSKTEQGNMGKKLFFEEDKKLISDFPAEQWTKIRIKNLFYNTPARLNYIKSEKTEYAHILEFLQNISIIYSHIWFTFISDDKIIFNYGQKEDKKTRIYNIYWASFVDSILDIDFSFSGIHIEGFISHPKKSFSNKNRQILFVNKRIVKSPIIYKAISDAYNRFIPHGSFPAYILSLSLDPSSVDVNVHPRKMEIRFADEQTLFRAVYNWIFWILEKLSLENKDEKDTIQEISWKKEAHFHTGTGKNFNNYSPYKDIKINPNQIKIQNGLDFTKTILSSQNISFEEVWQEWEKNEKDFDIKETYLWRIIGQIFNSYILLEWEKSLKIIDQHALAERILYEKLLQKKEDSAQKLLFQTSFQLTPKEQTILEENKETFEEMGFDFEFLSSGIVLLNQIPSFLEKENIEQIFLWIIEDIAEYNSWKSTNLEEVKKKILAFTACRSAIKFWNRLSFFEMNKLIEESQNFYSFTCPHGRPVIFEMSLEDLKNLFER